MLLQKAYLYLCTYLSDILLLRKDSKGTWSKSRFSYKKIVRSFFFLLAISNKPEEAYLQQKLKINVGIWPKPQISLIGKIFLEIGLNNKQTHVVGRKLGQNVWCTCNNFQNCIIGLKDMSQKLNFWAWLLMAQKIYFMKKVGGKGLDWCYIGESWRKLAEIG